MKSCKNDLSTKNKHTPLTKECFICKSNLPFNHYEVATKFVLKCDHNRVRVCIECDLNRAIKTLSVVAYNSTFKKYEVFKFKNRKCVINYYTHVKQVSL